MILTKEQEARVQEEIEKTEEEINQIQNKDKVKLISSSGIILSSDGGPQFIKEMETINLILCKHIYIQGLKDLLSGVEILAVHKNSLQTEITILERQLKVYLCQLTQLENEKARVLSLLK